jgi:hypothetical protein
VQRTDHVVVVLEDRQELFSERLRLSHATGIGHGLTTARLRSGKIDFTAVPLQQFQRGHGNLRIKLIDIAGNKQANAGHSENLHLERKQVGCGL